MIATFESVESFGLKQTMGSYNFYTIWWHDRCYPKSPEFCSSSGVLGIWSQPRVRQPQKKAQLRARHGLGLKVVAMSWALRASGVGLGWGILLTARQRACQNWLISTVNRSAAPWGTAASCSIAIIAFLFKSWFLLVVLSIIRADINKQ